MTTVGTSQQAARVPTLTTQAIEHALDQVETAIGGSPGLVYFERSRARYASDAALLAEINGDGPLVEIGAAPGHFTALLTLLGLTVVGVDLAPERIDPRLIALGMELRRCDIEREPLPFADGSVRQLAFCESFEHLRVDPLYTLSEINRVLALGARALVTTPNLYAVQQIGRFLTGRGIGDPLEEFDKLRAVGHMGHVREYSHAEMRRFLARAGLHIERTWFRHYWFGGGKRGLAKRVVFALAPRRFHSTQVMIVRKVADTPRLAPLAL